MRLAVFAGTLLAASPAFALDPATRPGIAENAAHSAQRQPFTATEGPVAKGVPVEAVLGGEAGEASWVARTGDEQAALGGLDPVSFFEPGGPKPGRAAYRAEYHGSVFYFADARHRELFLNAPERFAPAFGGYDPELLAKGTLAPADPQNWTVYNGRLFLSGSPDLKTEFDRHKPEVIRAAQDKWKAVDEMFEDRFFKAHQD